MPLRRLIKSIFKRPGSSEYDQHSPEGKHVLKYAPTTNVPFQHATHYTPYPQATPYTPYQETMPILRISKLHLMLSAEENLINICLRRMLQAILLLKAEFAAYARILLTT
jgi:hypothetical protein